VSGFPYRREELARLQVKSKEHEDKERQEGELRRRLPFLEAQLDFIREQCDHPDGHALPFPGEIGGSSVGYKACCILLSRMGEYRWQYCAKLGGFPPGGLRCDCGRYAGRDSTSERAFSKERR
jgi:hypothetical protein